MENNKNSNTIRKPNRLALEKSPYLLQHAHNPVDWYPWGSEAFEKAKREDKPIFLSSGYSTCHWCHVMEKESYEDEEVAELMNEAFVSIKIDREERPDIDGIYMKVCQAMSGSGGWPLNIIMTPDKKPFFAGTYIPKESRYGRTGMLELIPEIRDIWKKNRGKAESLAAQVVSSLSEEQEAGEELKVDVLHVAYEQLLEAFDEQHGGFGGAPKFPTPHNLTFLLRYWKRTGDIMALRMVERTLTAMSMGGIYDHAGFGFHRYSTDAKWLVPHFEKMLYDQALLAMAYTEAYQATGNQEFKRIACEVFTYVLRDMTSPEGGFYSGEDADSEGVEGKFYVWTENEIDSVLGENSELMKEIYDGAIPSGNSVAMLNLLRLGRMTANAGFEEKAEQIGRAFSKTIWQAPRAYTQMMAALDFALGPISEVVIAGDAGAQDTKAMLDALRREFIPGKVVILQPGEDTGIIDLAEYTRNLTSIEGSATAYVCRNYSCNLPVTDIEDMLDILRAK